jgi:hypothetical protein
MTDFAYLFVRLLWYQFLCRRRGGGAVRGEMDRCVTNVMHVGEQGMAECVERQGACLAAKITYTAKQGTWHNMAHCTMGHDMI